MQIERRSIASLESVRGLAALAVVGFHAATATPVGHEVWPKSITSLETMPELAMRCFMALCNGGAAVSVFFVLSGFVLELALTQNQRPAGPKAAAFVLRRLLRIYPALCINLLILAVCLWWLKPPGSPPVTMTGVVSNLLMLAPRVNGATWTLSVELSAIPFVLAAHFVANGRAPMLFGFALAVMPLVFLDASLNNIGEYLFMFLLGMTGANIRAPFPASANGIAVALMLLLGARPALGIESKLGVLAEGFSAAYIVTALASERVVRVRAMLEKPWLRFIGRISYSFYLYHVVASTLIIHGYFRGGLPDAGVGTALMLAMTIGLVTIPLAWCSWYFVERLPLERGFSFGGDDRWAGRSVASVARSFAAFTALVATRRLHRQTR